MASDRTVSETARVREKYRGMADSYDRQIAVMERILVGPGRRWVCSQAEGDVLELAGGTGRNFEFYPAGVRVTGIELSPEMLAIAEERAKTAGAALELREGNAHALEFEDASFDTVVCTLSLCSIPDDRAAVAEVRRVLRPGGRFLLLEHVRSPLRGARATQGVLEPLAQRFEAAHLLREPLEHLQALDFEI